MSSLSPPRDCGPERVRLTTLSRSFQFLPTFLEWLPCPFRLEQQARAGARNRQKNMRKKVLFTTFHLARFLENETRKSIRTTRRNTPTRARSFFEVIRFSERYIYIGIAYDYTYESRWSRYSHVINGMSKKVNKSIGLKSPIYLWLQNRLYIYSDQPLLVGQFEGLWELFCFSCRKPVICSAGLPENHSWAAQDAPLLSCLLSRELSKYGAGFRSPFVQRFGVVYR